MAPRAGIKTHFPCDLAIMTGAAKLACLNGIHGDFVCACLHLENGRVTRIAFKPDAMEPVWENRWRCSSLATRALENDVSFYGQGGTHEKTGYKNECK